MQELLSTRADQVFVLASVIGMLLWVWALVRSGGPRRALERLCPARDRKLPFWSPLDAFFLFMGTKFVTASAAMVLVLLGLLTLPRGPSTPFYEFHVPTDPVAGAVAMIFGGMVSVVAITAFMRLRNPNAISAMGWRWKSSDILLGLKWAFLVLPPVYLLAEIVSNHVAEYEHEVLEGLKTVEGPAAISMIFLATAVVAPILEEFLFRGLMQGSLEYVGSFRRRHRVESSDSAAKRSVKMESSTIRSEASPASADEDPQWARSWRPDSVWPVIFSSALFALAHLGQGAAWIPLFLFSLALGWLYRQTGSLVAPIVLHATLNFVTLVLTLIFPQAS